MPPLLSTVYLVIVADYPIVVDDQWALELVHGQQGLFVGRIVVPLAVRKVLLGQERDAHSAKPLPNEASEINLVIFHFRNDKGVCLGVQLLAKRVHHFKDLGPQLVLAGGGLQQQEPDGYLLICSGYL